MPEPGSFTGLDPELAALLAKLPMAGASGFDDMDVVRAMRDTKSLLRSLGRPLPTHAHVRTEDRTVAGPAGSAILVRCYTPEEHHGGVLVFFHGGGYVIGDVYTEEQRCLELAAGARCVVVSVGYALAPEEPYPAALLDASAALHWVAEHSAELGADARRLAVGGSSAGGGLAAAVSLWARDQGGPPIAFQLLVYPMLDDRMDSVSMERSDGMALLDRRTLAQAWRHYLGSGPADSYAAPARATDLSGLPPAFVLVAGEDPLRDEDLAYARRLVEAGVPTELHLYPGTFHGFDLVGARTEVGRRALTEQCGALQRALAPDGSRHDEPDVARSAPSA